MSLPYESNSTNWAGIRVIDAWIEYPFANDGDATSKEYKMLCTCKSTVYAAPAFTHVMSSAAVAKVLVLPFTADSDAYFTGDEGHAPTDGGQISFTRTFSPVPATRTRGIGSYSHTWPAFRGWNDTTQPNDATVFNQANELLPPEYILREPLTATSPATIDYTYYYATNISSVTKDTLFEPKWPDDHRYDDFRGLATGNYLVGEGSGGTPNESNPTLSAYKSAINSTFYIVASVIKSYKGNIYVKETIKALAQ